MNRSLVLSLEEFYKDLNVFFSFNFWYNFNFEIKVVAVSSLNGSGFENLFPAI